MEKGLNRVFLVGHVGQDVETRHLTSGQCVANISMATKSIFKGHDGQTTDRTEWHRVVVWGKTAEFAGKYIRKGAQLLVEGRLQTDEWEKDGVKRYSTQIVASRIQTLGKRTEAKPSPAEDYDLGDTGPVQ